MEVISFPPAARKLDYKDLQRIIHGVSRPYLLADPLSLKLNVENSPHH